MAGGANKGRPHLKTMDRIRIAVRIQLKNLGITDAEIAQHVGMSASSFSILKKTQAYRTVHNEQLTGVLSNLDEDIEQSYTQTQRMLDRALPTCIENLIAIASGNFKGQSVDHRLIKDASETLLDRQGRFAKVSRVGLPTREQNSAAGELDTQIAGALINNLKTAKTQAEIDEEPITDSVQ